MNEDAQRLCYVCSDIFSGRTPSYEFDNEKYIIIGQKNNQNSGLDMSDLKYAKSEFHDGMPEKYFLRRGDILLNSLGGGSVGRIGYFDLADNDILTDGHLIVFRVNENTDSKYVYYALKQMQKDLEDLAVGSTNQCFLNVSDVYKLRINYPSKKTQIKISNFLDSKCSEIDSLISDIQSEITTLEEYKKSVIYDAVCHGINNEIMIKTESDVWKAIPPKWKLVDIKYLFEIVKRIAGIEGFDVLSVTQKGLKVKDLVSGEGQLADNYSGYQFVYPTDYVMNHMDLLTGWVDLSTMFGVTSPDYRVFRLRDKENYNLDFYKYVMQCCYLNKIFYSLGQGVSNLGRWRLQTSSFNNFKVPVPPLNEQKEIAQFLNKTINETNNVIDIKQKQLATLEEYKKSIIYEYVTGKKEVPVGVSIK